MACQTAHARIKSPASGDGSSAHLTASNMPQLRYILGDAACPIGKGKGNTIIAHLCNDIGVWDSDFALAISERWKQTKAYCEKKKSAQSLSLGELSLIQVKKNIWIANMIALRGVRALAGTPPIRYRALERCLGTLALRAEELNATVHMPRIGGDPSGGKWELIEPLIHGAFGKTAVFIYDTPSK